MTELNYSAFGHIEYKGKTYTVDELFPGSFHATLLGYDGLPSKRSLPHNGPTYNALRAIWQKEKSAFIARNNQRQSTANDARIEQLRTVLAAYGLDIVNDSNALELLERIKKI